MDTKRNPNKIYLSLLREGDMFVVRDQDGREVAGVKEISLNVAIEEVATFGIVIIDAPTDQSRGQAHTGGAV